MCKLAHKFENVKEFEILPMLRYRCAKYEVEHGNRCEKQCDSGQDPYDQLIQPKLANFLQDLIERQGVVGILGGGFQVRGLLLLVSRLFHVDWQQVTELISAIVLAC